MKLLILLPVVALVLGCGSGVQSAPAATLTPTLTPSQIAIETCRDLASPLWFFPESGYSAQWEVIEATNETKVIGISESLGSGLMTRETATCFLDWPEGERTRPTLMELTNGDFSASASVNTEHGLPDPYMPK